MKSCTITNTFTDNTPPTTTITGGPAQNSLTNDRNPSFTFTGSDDVTPAGSLTFQCQLDGTGFVLCSSPTSYTNVVDGSHTFEVRAKDAAHNVDPSPASRTWTIDGTAPDTSIDNGPSGLVNTASASFAFSGTDNYTPTGSLTFECQLDAGLYTACTSPQVYSGLGDSSHTFPVRAIDQATNQDQTPASRTWTVDTSRPDTTITGHPTDPTTSNTATFTFNASDVSGDTFECKLDTDAWEPLCTSPKTYNSLALGTHTFSATFTWTIGAVTAAAFSTDEDFNRFDGFDFVFGNGTGTKKKINSTSPGTFRHRILITNNTGTVISPATGTTATTILTVPGTPTGDGACGFVPCSTFAGASPNPAFALRSHKAAHIWPRDDDHDGRHDDDDDDDDLPVSIQYMSLAQYVANGNSCDVTPSAAYSNTIPADRAAKCIKISNFIIPVRHKARLRLNFESRLKGTDGWDANSKDRMFMGFRFESKTTINFPSSTQTATTADGIIGAGSNMSAIGGFVLNQAGTPQSGLTVRLFNQVAQASCTDNTYLVSQDVTDANGFYFIYRTGTNQYAWASPTLPAGVKYAVQLCNTGPGSSARRRCGRPVAGRWTGGRKGCAR